MAGESGQKSLEMRVAELEDKLSKLQAGTQTPVAGVACIYCVVCYSCYYCRCWTECTGCGQPCGGPCIQQIQPGAIPGAFGRFGS